MRSKHILCAVCFFVLLGCEKKSDAPSAAADVAPIPKAVAIPSIQLLSTPIDKAVVEIKDNNPCFSWDALSTSGFESYTVVVSTTTDFPATRWQHKLTDASATTVCWNRGASWDVKGSKPPIAAADLAPGVTYYWRVASRHSGTLVFSETRSFTMAVSSSSSDTSSAK